MILPTDDENLSNIDTSVRWVESYAEADEGFYTDILPALEELSDSDPESVRIVFFFWGCWLFRNLD